MIRQYTLIAAVISVLLLGAFVWWFQGNLAVNGAYVALATAATLSVPLMYRLFGFALQDDARWLQEREAREHGTLHLRLDDLKKDLRELNLKEGLRQADALGEILDDYHAVVENRFAGKQSSPLTYLGAARTVQRQAIQNLSDAVAVARSMSSLESNRRSAQWSDEKNRQEQDGMYAEQANRLQQLLHENNELFDALTKTSVELANMRSVSEFERTDTLARLVALAQIANQAGKTG